MPPARGTAAAALIALLAVLSGCSRGPHHPGWVIHSALEMTGPAPASGYRLVFPYIVGDFYGAPTTGDFVVPVNRTDSGFTLDLNRTQEALESELGPTNFSLPFLEITPAEARIARLAPAALQPNGIDSVGTVEWLDSRSRRPLMLVYVDRPARIEGSLTRGGVTTRYDIRVAKAGYVWIGGIQAGEHETLYTVVQPPRHLVLTITTRPSKSAAQGAARVGTQSGEFIDTVGVLGARRPQRRIPDAAVPVHSAVEYGAPAERE
ncbi:MAG: hypothetical protein HIU85_00525 [Proteobacteria bacterium]|nr:hypothetical protein [Pseudomonadota bacterium]